jgi:hypothetical protein
MDTKYFFVFTSFNYSIDESVDSQDQKSIFKKLEEIAKEDTFVNTIKEPLSDYAINSVIGFKIYEYSFCLRISGVEVHHRDDVTVVVYNLKWFDLQDINQVKIKKIADYLVANWNEKNYMQSFLK